MLIKQPVFHGMSNTPLKFNKVHLKYDGVSKFEISKLPRGHPFSGGPAVWFGGWFICWWVTHLAAGDQGKEDHHLLRVWRFEVAGGIHCGEGPFVSWILGIFCSSKKGWTFFFVRTLFVEAFWKGMCIDVYLCRFHAPLVECTNL